MMAAAIDVDVADWLVKCDSRHLTICAAAALTERQRSAAVRVREACESGACCALSGIPETTLALVRRAAAELRPVITALGAESISVGPGDAVSIDDDCGLARAAAIDAFAALRDVADATLKLVAAAFDVHELALATGPRADRLVAGQDGRRHALALRFSASCPGAVLATIGRLRSRSGASVAAETPLAALERGLGDGPSLAYLVIFDEDAPS